MSTSDNSIHVSPRETTGKGPARRMRAEGNVPAIIYGHGKTPSNLMVAETEITPFLHHTGLVKLKIEGKKTPKTAIVKDFQMNMLKNEVIHVDFMEVKADEVISATVEVIAQGTAAGTALGGMLDQILHDIEIRGAANKLPESIEADISGLQIGDTLTIGDLELPDGIEAVAEEDQIVFSCHVARIEEPEPEEEEGVEGVEEGLEEGAEGAEAGDAEESTEE